MSLMFRRALEAHIKQLTHALQKPDNQDITANLKHIDALLSSTTDGRFKRALRNARQRMEEADTASNSEDLRQRLDALRKIFQLIKDHPNYAQKQRRQGSGRRPGRPRKNPSAE